MADYYQYQGASTPWGMWRAIIQAMVSSTSGSPLDSWGIDSVDTVYGPGVDVWVVYEGSPDTQHWVAVWIDATWATPMPPRAWCGQSGASGELQTGTWLLPQAGVTWTDRWAALIVAVQDWAYVALDAVSVAVLDAQVALVDDLYLQLGTMVLLVDGGEAQPSYVVWSIQGTPPPGGAPGDVSGILLQSYAPAIGAVTLQPGMGPDGARIAEALETISLQDQEISINHGAAMWSINGRVRVG